MIAARSISKFFGYGTERQDVLTDLSFALEPGASAIIYGLPRSGKSTLAAILAGLSRPNKGNVVRQGVISVPIGSPAVLTFGDTPSELCYILAKLYSMKTSLFEDFVEDFADLHGWMDSSCRALSSKKRQKMLLGLGYGLDADGYLIDGVPYRGTTAFAQKCRHAFELRMRTATCLCITEDLKPEVVPNAVGGILRDGKVDMYATAEQAAQIYAKMQAEAALDLVEHARGLMRAGDQDQARMYLEEVITRDPSNSSALDLLSRIAWRENDFSRVLAICASVPDVRSSSTDLLLMRARAAERVYDWNEVLESATEILRRDPQHREAAALVAKSHRGLGNHADAAAIWMDLAGGQMGRELVSAARGLSDAKMWSELLDLVEQTPFSSKVDPTFMNFGLRAAVSLNEPQRAYALLLDNVELSSDALYSSVARYRQQLGWQLVSKLVIEFESIGKTISPDVSGCDILLRFLQRERALALKATPPPDMSELDQALALMSRADAASAEIEA